MIIPQYDNYGLLIWPFWAAAGEAKGSVYLMVKLCLGQLRLHILSAIFSLSLLDQYLLHSINPLYDNYRLCYLAPPGSCWESLRLYRSNGETLPWTCYGSHHKGYTKSTPQSTGKTKITSASLSNLWQASRSPRQL